MKPDRRTERGFDRLVNFSDAVVAIAITLLVLPLADLVREVAEVPVTELLEENYGEFLGFLLTFLVTAIFWMVHHRVFELIGQYDSGLMWLNMLWLMFMVLLPFASGTVSGGDGFADGAGVVYAGDMACIALSQGLICLYVRSHGLLGPGVEPAELHPERSWVYAGFFAVIAVVSLLSPMVAQWAMILLIPIGRLVADR